MNGTADSPGIPTARRIGVLLATVLVLMSLVAVRDAAPVSAAAATLTVNATSDGDVADSVLTLHEAIKLATGTLSVSALTAGECAQVSNSTYTPPCSTTDTVGPASADTISFNVGTFPRDTNPSTGRITLSTSLPTLSGSDADIINATTTGVDIEGNSTFDCFNITGSNKTVVGVKGVRFCDIAFNITGGGNTIGGANTADVCGGADADQDGFINDGCPAVGTPESGSQCLDNPAVDDDADGALNDGCPARGQGINMRANDVAGVVISGESADGNAVRGSYIGTDPGGTAANSSGGVVIEGGADGNTIGGTTTPGLCTADCNVISGNTGEGVLIRDDGSTGNTVSGNFIGVSVTGSADLGNTASGVYILRAQSNSVGGTVGGAINVISGNDGFAGVSICGNPTFCGGEGSPGPGDAGANVVQGNFIGVNTAGTASIGNLNRGVAVDGAPNVVIGGAGSGRNIISGNGTDGVILFNGTNGGVIRNNFIGANKAGTGAIPNGTNGVSVSGGAYNNTVGGTTADDRNVVSGNAIYGIVIESAGTTGNSVKGNYVGTDVTGTAAIANISGGVVVQSSASGNTVGGTSAGARNVISGNGGGVGIMSSAFSNTVQGNYIGLDATGAVALANSNLGVIIQSGASNNTIGGASVGARNVISGNINGGVTLNMSGTTGNVVRGNYIGPSASGSGGVGNGFYGVDVIASVTSTTIGGVAAGEGNVIAFNSRDGVCIIDTTGPPTGISIRGNSIDSNGPSGGLGIDLVPNGGDCFTSTVTPNDAGDSDAGPNGLMNFPVITSATFDGTNTTISGTLDTGSPATTLVDVYATDVADPSGNGEGRSYIGTAVPGGGGAWSLVISGLPPFPRLTATATDSGGSTSEFSAVYTMALTPGPGLPITTMARQGQATPIGGTFSSFGPAQVPSITGDPGVPSTTVDVAFWALVSGGSAPQAIFKWTSLPLPAGTISKLVAVGDPTPIGGTFSSFGTVPVMNGSNDVAFFANVSGGAAGQGIFRWSGGVVTKLVATGEATPAGGTYASFVPPSGPSVAVINSLGDVTFWASLSTGGQGLFRHSGSVAKVAATGDPTPVGGTFSSFLLGSGWATVPTITDNQETSFRAAVSGGSASEGIFLAGYGGTITKVVASGETTPAGGTYASFAQIPSPDESGRVTFWAVLSGSSASTCTNQGVPCGVFRRESGGGITKIIAGGDAGPPGVGGTVSGIGTVPLMNDAGQISVWTGITNGFAAQSLVRYTNGALVNVAAIGNPTTMTPSPGTFSGFIDATALPTNPIPNNKGQVAFWGAVSGGSGTEGIFVTNAPATITVGAGPVAGASAPGTNGGTFGPNFDLGINSAGNAVFANTVTGGSASSGIFLFFAGQPVDNQSVSGQCLQNVALASQDAPGGGTFNTFYPPVNNDNNAIVARATTNGGPGEGLYLFFAGAPQADCTSPSLGVTKSRLAASNGLAPGGGTYSQFGNPSINNVGQVAATANVNGGNNGLFLFFAGSPPNGCTPIDGWCKGAEETGAAPGVGGTYLFFAGGPSINESGQVAQRAVTASGDGLYLFFAGAPQAGCTRFNGIDGCKLAEHGDLVPPEAGGGQFDTFNLPEFGDPAINKDGTVVAAARLTNGTKALYTFSSSGTITKLADTATSGTPVGGSYSGFSGPTINDAGAVVARATVSGGTATDGLFLFFAGQPTRKLAAAGEPVPPGGGGGTYGVASPVFPFAAMDSGNPLISRGAQVVFVANLTPSPPAQGVFFASLDLDNDGVLDVIDNCPPPVANGDQKDPDHDGKGNPCDDDDDGDGMLDTVESQCGVARPDVLAYSPERVDGAFAGRDDDGDTLIDEALPPGAAGLDCDGDGWSGSREAGTPLCGNGINDDFTVNGGSDDGVVDDGCPGGPAQEGAYSEAQFHIGLSDQDPCGNNGWPAELAGGDNRLTLQDITSFTTPAATRKFGTSPGNPNFNSRWDLVPGNGGGASPWIALSDITSLTTGSTSRPPMLGGVRAFGGPACPWAP